jgi:hypothetical protein
MFYSSPTFEEDVKGRRRLHLKLNKNKNIIWELGKFAKFLDL